MGAAYENSTLALVFISPSRQRAGRLRRHCGRCALRATAMLAAHGFYCMTTGQQPTALILEINEDVKSRCGAAIPYAKRFRK